MSLEIEGCAAEESPAARVGKPALAERPLLSMEQVSQLAGLFKVLGNDTRLRMLHALHRGGQVAVGELAEQVGCARRRYRISCSGSPTGGWWPPDVTGTGCCIPSPILASPACWTRRCV